MENSFLEYYKTILEKVSFDSQLLTREFEKAVKSIENHEKKILIEWMRNKGLQTELISLKNSAKNSRFF